MWAIFFATGEHESSAAAAAGRMRKESDEKKDMAPEDDSWENEDQSA